MKTTLLLAFSLAAGAAHAQTPAPTAAATTAQVDARFANWLGCWRLEDDLAGTGARMALLNRGHRREIEAAVHERRQPPRIHVHLRRTRRGEEPIADLVAAGVEQAQVLEKRIEQQRLGLLTLLEPIMIAFLGVIVGGIVIAMYLPIFDLISKLT